MSGWVPAAPQKLGVQLREKFPTLPVDRILRLAETYKARKLANPSEQPSGAKRELVELSQSVDHILSKLQDLSAFSKSALADLCRSSRADPWRLERHRDSLAELSLMLLAASQRVEDRPPGAKPKEAERWLVAELLKCLDDVRPSDRKRMLIELSGVVFDALGEPVEGRAAQVSRLLSSSPK